MQIYKTVVGNNAPDLVITCKRNSVVIDVSGATVTLIIKNERINTITNAINQSCSLTSPTIGVVTYSPSATDFVTEDRYLGDVKIVYNSGKIEYLREEVLVIARNK